jgi:hypothetical protein
MKNNNVAKFASRVNRASVHKDRKKEVQKLGKSKHTKDLRRSEAYSFWA